MNEMNHINNPQSNTENEIILYQPDATPLIGCQSGE